MDVNRESIRPDLEGTTCSISDCINVGDVVGWLTIKLSPLIGAVPADERQTIEFPLCIQHAHLLRMGGDMVEFHEGMQ